MTASFHSKVLAVTENSAIRIAFIGFGEVGQRFSADFMRGENVAITAYDLVFEDPSLAAARIAKAQALRISPAASAASACRDARFVISAVTADAVETVAAEARHYLAAGQFFFDVNSASPSTKQRAARHVEASGAHYIEGAVMGPVLAPGIRVPILAGGPAADEAVILLNSLGMNVRAVAPEHGKASAIKLCRSIVIKGLEALMVDCARAARQADVAPEVFASLAETFPSIDWPALADNMAERVAKHGVRRSAEMQEAAEMLADMGLAPDLARAVAEAQARGARR
jgi:3-hydroxyisobutyrate dehydrogenase-like beta-hydroxyacid dehydrogenase